MYISDRVNHRIRKVTMSTGIITTTAGTGSTSYSGDNGAATSATLYFPEGSVIDASGTHQYIAIIRLFGSNVTLFVIILFIGNVYISDANNHRIRKVTVSTGIISTIAGTGTRSFSGDNGPATSATFWNPTGISVDSSGNDYYIYNHIQSQPNSPPFFF